MCASSRPSWRSGYVLRYRYMVLKVNLLTSSRLCLVSCCCELCGLLLLLLRRKAACWHSSRMLPHGNVLIPSTNAPIVVPRVFTS